jgi:hypothetical protein
MYNWGPHYIIPSEVLQKYSGNVLLREEFDEDLLQKQLEELSLAGPIVRINNPWYYRKKKTDTWIRIGESENKEENFPVRWDTTGLPNGEYEVMGLMHVFVKKDNKQQAIARENIVKVTIQS